MQISGRINNILCCLAILCVAVMPAGCKKAAPVDTSVRQREVFVKDASSGEMPVTVAFTGNLYSHNEASVVPREGGQVESIFVDEGDSVAEGQVLLKINDDKLIAQRESLQAQLNALQNQYQQAQLDLSLADSSVAVGVNQADQNVLQAQSAADQVKLRMDQAKIDLDRQESLYSKGAVSKQSLENAQLSYDTSVKQYHTALSAVKNANESLVLAQANNLQKDMKAQTIESVQAQIEAVQANINSINISIRDCEVKAPFSGVITYRDKKIAKSSMVAANASSPVFKMVDNSSLYMEGLVPEGKVSAVKQGDPIVLTVDSYPGRKFEASVDTIVPCVDSVSMAFKVRAVVSNSSDELTSGMFARAEIEVARPSGVIVPYAGLIKTPELLAMPGTAVEGSHKAIDETEFSERFTLFVAKDGKAVKKNVIAGAYTQDFALITGGATDKDEITDKDKIIVTSVTSLQDGEPIKIQDEKKADEGSESKEEKKSDESKDSSSEDGKGDIPEKE